MKKLYIVSLGPGDYELITLKALKCLFSSDLILISGRGDFRSTRGFKILEDLFSDERFNSACVSMPPIVGLKTSMRVRREDWEVQVDKIVSLFGEGNSVLSYITLGDASIYSSAYYLLDILKERFPDIYDLVEVVAGVSSFSFASSRVKLPLCLGGSGFMVLPWGFDLSGLDMAVDMTRVYMKPNSGDGLGFLGDDAIYFENLCFSGERFMSGLPSGKPPYLSLLIDFVRGND